VEEEAQRILDTYEPILLEDSDPHLEDMQDVPIISDQAALEGLEALRLFRLQKPHVNSQRGEQVGAVLYRQKRDIDSTRHGSGCTPSACYHGVLRPLSDVS